MTATAGNINKVVSGANNKAKWLQVESNSQMVTVMSRDKVERNLMSLNPLDTKFFNRLAIVVRTRLVRFEAHRMVTAYVGVMWYKQPQKVIKRGNSSPLSCR